MTNADPAGARGGRGGVAPVSKRSAIILCGGRSRRFGADKALAVHENRTFLERVIDVCRATASEVILATGAEPRYEELGLPIALDAAPDGGPLAGIAAGLEKCSSEFFLVIAVDLPFLTVPAVEALFAALYENECVLPRSDEGVEPLFSAGRTAPCRDAARLLIASGPAAAHRLSERVSTTYLPVTAVGNSDVWRAVRNINRPEDLEGRS